MSKDQRGYAFIASVFVLLSSFFAPLSVQAQLGLVAHWGFDETGGKTAFDSVGVVNGALFGGAAFTTTGGISGGALQITNGYVDMGNNFPASSTFSIQSWVKTSPSDFSGMMPVAKHWSGIGQGYFLAINNVGDGFTRTNYAGFYSANNTTFAAVGGLPVNDGKWHQLVGVYNNGTISIYIDGNLANSGSIGYSNNSAHFMVGGFFSNSGSPVNYFRGLIDEVEVYNIALSGNDVKALYNSYFTSYCEGKVSAQVTTSGFIYSRSTKTYHANVTVKNTGTQYVNGPVYVVFANLSAGVTLVNPSGSSLGSPYAVIPTLNSAPDVFAPNQSVSFPVQFNATVPINFTNTVCSGRLNP